MLVLHANWTNGALHLWGESLETYIKSPRLADVVLASTSVDQPSPTAVSGTGAVGVVSPAQPQTRSAKSAHPFACGAQQLREALVSEDRLPPLVASVEENGIELRLPCDSHGPCPSDRLARRAGAIEMPEDPWLSAVDVPSISFTPAEALPILLQFSQRESSALIDYGSSLRFWMSAAALIVDLLADQRFVPMMSPIAGHRLKAAWQPWVHDDDVRQHVTDLHRSMPPIARAVVDRHHHQSAPMLDEALRLLTDAAVRSVLSQERFIDALDGRNSATDPHVAWLSGLLDWSDDVATVANGASAVLARDASQWIARLDERGRHRDLRLCLKLLEPTLSPTSAKSDDSDSHVWPLTFHLQSGDESHQLLDAAHIWNPSTAPAGMLSGAAASSGLAQETLLAELGRASRVYPKIETALVHSHPTRLNLTTVEAHQFLTDVRPVLEESGVATIVPEWWEQPTGRLAARLHIESPTADSIAGEQGEAPVGLSAGTSPSSSVMGLNTLVNFQWRIAIGDQPLTEEEFRTLARKSDGSPLVRVHGRWIEVNPKQLAEAREFMQRSPAGKMTLLQAIHAAHGVGGHTMSLPVIGLDATGWVADLLFSNTPNQRMTIVDQPESFQGSLRPYQKTGLSWLAFLDRFGLGACLADDMGLGKTIQLIALLLHERKSENRNVEVSPGPTLLVVPTSVVANWERELQRFAPSLRVHVHHGTERTLGDPFVPLAAQHDMVITTYPLISRDIETLRRAKWHRVALDEAQYIKNPPTKQTTAIRSLNAPRRLALTGTPVENRLAELWSIIEFCNPGYLGPQGEFRRKFSVPIERHRNRIQQDRLRDMVRPFILRRVKTDPKVINDLPACTETKEFATLTVEQATLYQQHVNSMLGEVDQAEGIRRRGLVLATLVRLKQICNHPEQMKGLKLQDGKLSDVQDSSTVPTPATPALANLSSRSGKARRLMVMLEEVVASGEKALIFTQFRQMGHLLTAMIQNDLDCQTLFLHGGTPAAKRQQMIDRFQANDGGVPIFVLSLKAGGLGLNLTAANHVFHYDRWWNPAVENQATDRAYRIGQMRAVQVHKFVCIGTLEERIDQMIEQKTHLAQNIIGSGEQWLTELSTNQLHDLLTLRPSATEGET